MPLIEIHLSQTWNLLDGPTVEKVIIVRAPYGGQLRGQITGTKTNGTPFALDDLNSRESGVGCEDGRKAQITAKHGSADTVIFQRPRRGQQKPSRDTPWRHRRPYAAAINPRVR